MKKKFQFSKIMISSIPLFVCFFGFETMLYAQQDLGKAIVFRDRDMDNVPDCWDKCWETPLGSRVDGSGCALDTDMDGIIDLYDKCVTAPGTMANQGCPESEYSNELQGAFTSTQFDQQSLEIHSADIPHLKNDALKIIKFGGNEKFNIAGHANEFKDENKNVELSIQRAQAIKKALIELGVPADQLIVKGEGNSSPLYPECADAAKCKKEGNEWKNRANRRVDIQVSSQSIDVD